MVVCSIFIVLFLIEKIILHYDIISYIGIMAVLFFRPLPGKYRH